VPASPDVTTRYLPFAVVATVLALLVVLTPSKAPAGGSVDGLATADFSGAAPGGPQTGQQGAGQGGEGFAGEAGQPAAAADGGPAGEPLGGGSLDGTADRPEAGSGPDGTEPGAPGPVGAVDPGDRSRCDSAGMQKGPAYPTGVRCRPVFRGDNGGATMQGVTATEIRYVWYNPARNPAVNGILAAAGAAREPADFCPTMRAFERSVQKYYEMSGRKLVALDGPGNNAGSRSCDGQYAFFQSTCPTGSPDAACVRAEAATIATQLKPAFVLSPLTLPVFYEELARRKTIILGYTGSRARFQQLAPYAWGVGLSSERAMGLGAQYYCNRLVGQEPIYGGEDVKALPGTRHLGLVYPEDPSGSLKPAVDLWLKTVRGCGDVEAKAYSYINDASRAQEQSTNVVAQMKSAGVTTMGFCCDPVTYGFFHRALNQSNYYPEHLVLPFSSIASDVVGQLYEQTGSGPQWAHAFGLTNFAINRDDSDLEYRRAYADGGGRGGKAGAKSIEVESFRYVQQMMQMIHTAGPQLTPANAFRGMQDLPPVKGGKTSVGLDYAAPDPFVPQRDVAEVWWNKNLPSYYNGNRGAMCVMNGARRFSLGEWPRTRTSLFGGDSSCARLP
jgi:hypothetical protein